MTIAERNNKLKHFITCLKCEASGKVCDDNCPTQYDAGNMGEIIENLEAISKALEQEPRKGHWIWHENKIVHIECSECSSWFLKSNLLRKRFCPNCGADMGEDI